MVRELIEIASMGGNLLLNISPMGDGSIPEAQQQVLLAVGEWLKVNGEGIYGIVPWTRMAKGRCAEGASGRLEGRLDSESRANDTAHPCRTCDGGGVPLHDQ